MPCRCWCVIGTLSISISYQYLIGIDALSISIALSILMSYQYLNNIDVLPIPYRCRCCTDTLKLSICFFNIFISILSLLQRYLTHIDLVSISIDIYAVLLLKHTNRYILIHLPLFNIPSLITIILTNLRSGHSLNDHRSPKVGEN